MHTGAKRSHTQVVCDTWLSECRHQRVPLRASSRGFTSFVTAVQSFFFFFFFSFFFIKIYFLLQLVQSEPSALDRFKERLKAASSPGSSVMTSWLQYIIWPEVYHKFCDFYFVYKEKFIYVTVITDTKCFRAFL